MCLFFGGLQVSSRAADASPSRRHADSPAIAVISSGTPEDFGTLPARIRALPIDKSEPLTTVTITDAQLVPDCCGLRPRLGCLLADAAGGLALRSSDATSSVMRRRQPKGDGSAPTVAVFSGGGDH